MAACPGCHATVIAGRRADSCSRPGRRASPPSDASDGAEWSGAVGHRLAPPRSSRRFRPSGGDDSAHSCGEEQAPRATHHTQADRADTASTPRLRANRRSRHGATRRRLAARRCRPATDVAMTGHSSAAIDAGAHRSRRLMRHVARQTSHAPAHPSHASGQRPTDLAPGHPSYRRQGHHRQAPTPASVADASGAIPSDAAAAGLDRAAGCSWAAEEPRRLLGYTCSRLGWPSHRPSPARVALRRRGIRSCRAARWRHIANTAYRPSHPSDAADSFHVHARDDSRRPDRLLRAGGVAPPFATSLYTAACRRRISPHHIVSPFSHSHPCAVYQQSSQSPR